MAIKHYNGQKMPVTRHYNSVKNFVGENRTYPYGDILHVSTKNNEDYDLILMADGKSNFRELYQSGSRYSIVNVEYNEDTKEMHITIDR